METTICPTCAARLVIGEPSPGTVFVCAACQAQFSPDVNWPTVSTSRKAFLSLLLGVMSFGCLFATGIPAFVLGLWALGDIRQQGRWHRLKGRWMAVAGTALGGFGSLATLMLPIIALSYFGSWVADKRASNRVTTAPKPVEIPPDYVVIAKLDVGWPWRWLHPLDGVDPAESEPGFHESFFQMDYDDAEWLCRADSDAADRSGIGYGDLVAVDIETPRTGFRYTAYLRLRFNTARDVDELLLTYYRDDGTIIYLDGKEVARDNVRSGPETHRLLADQPVGGRAERRVVGLKLPGGLEPGEHLLAISVHNAAPDSSDLRIGAITLYGRPREGSALRDDALP